MDEGIQQRLDDFIRSKGLRKTTQRDSIVAVAFENEEHFTADELYDRVKSKNLNASRATVYRTLNLLIEVGLLREIDLGGAETTYDPNFVDKPSHNHLICIDCGKVLEFEDEHIELLNDCMTRRLGFRPKSQSLRIEACCEKLRANGRCENLIQARIQGKRLPNKSR